MTYSYDDTSADFHAVLTDGDGTGFTHFDIHWAGGVIRDCVVGIPGWVNIENAVGAAAIGLTYGLDPEKIREALASFGGVKRRFDIQLKSDRCIYIDDYAHHPEEITATQIIAVTKSYSRNGKTILCNTTPYKLKSALWCSTRAFRPLIFKLSSFLKGNKK